MKRIKTIAAVLALAMVFMAGCGGGGGSNTAANDWTENAGTYFTVSMPGKATLEEQKAEELAALGEMTMKMYLYETDDKKEAYAVVEMDWSSLIDQFKDIADDSMKEEFSSAMLSGFGGSADASVSDVGNMKGIKLGEEALNQFGLEEQFEGSDVKVDVYLVPTDQAIMVFMYGGEGSSFNADNSKAFFDSVKGVNTTTDFMSLE